MKLLYYMALSYNPKWKHTLPWIPGGSPGRARSLQELSEGLLENTP